MLVAVSGTIGAGKSTFCGQLAQELGYEIVPEPVRDNPYLSDFYEDPHRWAFASQVFMVTHRFRRYLDVSRLEGGFVFDRFLFEDRVFAEVCRDMGYMTPREWDTYEALQESFIGTVRQPDLVIYLRVTPETANRRIVSRGRLSEQSIGIDYLRRLHVAYENWIGGLHRKGIPTRVVDWSTFRPIQEVMGELPL